MLIRTAADVGAAIRDRRRLLGLDQATLAARIGATRQWVIKIEQGSNRAELGLVLRAVAALGLQLHADGDAGEIRKSAATQGIDRTIDIDAIVNAARENGR